MLHTSACHRCMHAMRTAECPNSSPWPGPGDHPGACSEPVRCGEIWRFEAAICTADFAGHDRVVIIYTATPDLSSSNFAAVHNLPYAACSVAPFNIFSQNMCNALNDPRVPEAVNEHRRIMNSRAHPNPNADKVNGEQSRGGWRRACKHSQTRQYMMGAATHHAGSMIPDCACWSRWQPHSR